MCGFATKQKQFKYFLLCWAYDNLIVKKAFLKSKAMDKDLIRKGEQPFGLDYAPCVFPWQGDVRKKTVDSVSARVPHHPLHFPSQQCLLYVPTCSECLKNLPW